MALKLIWDEHNKDAAEAYLDKNGFAVLATGVVAALDEAPKGAKLVGTLDTNTPSDRQMTSNGQVTSLGADFCTVRGVEPKAASLKAYMSNTKEGTSVPHILAL